LRAGKAITGVARDLFLKRLWSFHSLFFLKGFEDRKSIFSAWNLHRRTQKFAVLLLLLSQLSSPASAGTFKEITDFSSGEKIQPASRCFFFIRLSW
jgi:hypothetical protein